MMRISRRCQFNWDIPVHLLISITNNFIKYIYIYIYTYDHKKNEKRKR